MRLRGTWRRGVFYCEVGTNMMRIRYFRELNYFENFIPYQHIPLMQSSSQLYANHFGIARSYPLPEYPFPPAATKYGRSGIINTELTRRFDPISTWPGLNNGLGIWLAKVRVTCHGSDAFSVGIILMISSFYCPLPAQCASCCGWGGREIDLRIGRSGTARSEPWDLGVL